jgi:hypothetical protein
LIVGWRNETHQNANGVMQFAGVNLHNQANEVDQHHEPVGDGLDIDLMSLRAGPARFCSDEPVGWEPAGGRLLDASTAFYIFLWR